jgi:EmrB/QacA subfamily drug resistance transporter
MRLDPGDSSGSVALDSTTGRVVVATTVLGSAVAQLTATVVNVALPSIAVDLDAGSAGQQWIVNAYLVTLASLILVGGTLGDRFGRLRTYRLGVAWFGAASLLCAVAPSTEALIGARLLQGVGGALLTPGSLAIIEATLRRDDRGRGVGAWSGLGGVAGAIGPLVGGLVVEASWRWVFLLNLPIAVLALVLSRWVPESRDHDARHTPLDVGGALLTVVLLGGASYALIQAPSAGVGASVVVAGTAALLALVALVRWERGRAGAMVPVDLFTERAFVAANTVTFVVYGGLGVVFFLLSIQLQVSAGWSPLAAGASLLPVTALMLTLSSRAGAWAGRIGPRWPLTIGPAVMSLGMLLMTRIDAEATFVVDVLPATLVFGLGLSATVAPVTAAALGSVPDRRAGAASGTNNAVARTGQLLAVAAVPLVVGLTGDALSEPAALAEGFVPAVLVAAGLVALGSLVALVMFRDDDLCKEDAISDEGTVFVCGVDGPPTAAEHLSS